VSDVVFDIAGGGTVTIQKTLISGAGSGWAAAPTGTNGDTKLDGTITSYATIDEATVPVDTLYGMNGESVTLY
jgi:hypothetical protein